MPTLSGSTISVRTNSPKPRAFRAALASLSSLVNPKISLSQHTTLGGHHRCDTLPVRYSKKGTFFPWPSDTRVDMEPSCQPKPLRSLEGSARVTPVYSLGEVVSPFLKNLIVG